MNVSKIESSLTLEVFYFIHHAVSYCLSPLNPPAGVVITTVVEGSVIIYKCEEGLVIEGEVMALCGADGEWRPHPTSLNCSDSIDVASELLPTSITSGTTHGKLA
jgi:hypothetical protein